MQEAGGRRLGQYPPLPLAPMVLLFRCVWVIELTELSLLARVTGQRVRCACDCVLFCPCKMSAG